MEPKIWISEIEFSNGSKISFESNDIIVFVGPNNAGKSACLKEASNYLKTKNTKSKVIKGIIFSKSGSKDDLIKFIDKISIKEFSSNNDPYYHGLGYVIYGGNINHSWDNISNGIDSLADLFAKYLTTEERLNAANPAGNIKLTSEPAKHPINTLQKSDTLEKQFNDYFKQAFGIDLVVHRNAGSQVPLYVGKAPVILPGQDRLSEAYQTELEKLDLLHEQGDGMRSFVGVLLNAFVDFRSILFIDEPEAFLHPPQAYILSKMLAKDLPSNRQLLLATHSTDFLKGLLDANAANLKIVRIQRTGSINNVSVLNKAEINLIWSDSLMRHSNVLEGLFHNQVVICESDSDCRFYSAILAAIHEKTNTTIPDTLFIHCGGKQRIPTVIKALNKLDVKIKVVCDFDVLNNISPLKEIYEGVGGGWTEIESEWKLVKSSIESKRPELEVKELKAEIEKILTSISDRIMPKEKISAIQKALKKASAWAHAKEIGKSFIPSGNATQAFEVLTNKLRSKGIFVIEVGELEGFVKTIGNHGPKWVNEVLAKDLINDTDLEPARQFVSELTK